MSLINRMLKDLDARRAADARSTRMHSDVRPLPAPPRRVWPWIAGAGGLVALSVAATWAWMVHGPGRPLPVLDAPKMQQAVNVNLPPLALAQEAVAAVPPPLLPALPAEPAPAAMRVLPQPVPLRPAVPEVAAPVLPPAVRAAVPSKILPAAGAAVSNVQVPPKPAGNPVAPAKAAAAGGGVVAPSPRFAADTGSIDKQVVASTPQERAERLYQAALDLLAQGRGDEGFSTMRAALREDARHIPARQWLLKYYIDGRSYAAAQGVLEDGLQALPRQTSWALLLSRLLADRGDNTEALKVLEAALPFAAGNPGEADVRGALGAVLQRLSRHADAERHYVLATQFEPLQGRWWLGLALASEVQGRVPEARSFFQRAAETRTLSAEMQSFVEQKLK